MAVTITNDAATTRTNLGLGDAATKTVGTAAGNIPVLDGSGKLPAVNGENLTGIVALPTGGSVGQVVTNTSSGAGNWQDAAAGGKVLQMKIHNASPGYGQMGSAQVWSDSPFSITITPKSTTSQFFVTYQVGVLTIDNGGDSGYSLRVKRVTGGVTSYPTGLTTYDGSGTTHATYYENRGGWSGDVVRIHSNIGFDNVTHNLSDITYTVQGAHYSTNTMRVGSLYEMQCQFVVMEVEV